MSLTCKSKIVARKLYHRASQRSSLREYLHSHNPVKISLGSGGTRRAGWLTTDVEPAARDITFLDARKKFPLPDESVDYFSAEHVIEHLALHDGFKMLSECYRTLRVNGRLRLATPNIRLYRGFLADELSAADSEYVRWSNVKFGSALEQSMPDNACVALNRSFRAWGHKFLYDQPTLEEMLRRAGFSEMHVCQIGESTDFHLRGVEMRQGGEDDFANSFETMVYEAVKRG